MISKAQEKIDREFIRYENKDILHSIKLKLVSYDTLSEFRHELNLYALLEVCCEENNAPLVTSLISWGVDVNSRPKNEIAMSYIVNLNGDTPLMIAIENDSHDCINVLLESGADVNKGNMFGSTPLHYAHSKGSLELFNLLIDMGAIIKADHFGVKPGIPKRFT